MITTLERKELKKNIGSQHISKVSKYFVKNDIKNRDGAYYSTSFISRIFNGKDENEKVEAGIWKCAEERQNEKAEINAIKNKVLETSDER